MMMETTDSLGDRERATSGVDWGWGGWGHPCVLPSLAASSGRTSGRAPRALPSSGFRGQKRPASCLSLAEMAISLNCEQNSTRKFQTGVSNSGPQIPKHARQNSEVPEITYFSRQNRGGGGRIFLATGFSILVSAFEFTARAGIWDASHFWFLDSQCKTTPNHVLLGSHFAFSCSKPALCPWNLR